MCVYVRDVKDNCGCSVRFFMRKRGPKRPLFSVRSFTTTPPPSVIILIKSTRRSAEMSYRLSNISREMARFMRTHSSSSSSARGSSNSSSMNSSMNSSSSSSSSSRQKQIFCNNNSSNCNGFGIVSRPTNTNIGIGSLRSFADIAAAQKNTQLNARVVAFALEALKLEAATTTARTNLNLVDLDEIILSTDSIGLFEEIEDT